MINHKLGPYRVIEQVGEGGMGAVYRAVDEMLGRDVAIKVLRPSLAHDAALVDRFRHEARSLALISHPNVAALYGLFEEQGTLFMAMEFVNGESADGMIRRRGRLPWTEAGAFMLDVLNGLEGAHRLGIIHRDLKPANLLVASSGAVKITDFGIARMLGTARYTRTGAVVGTLAYMAPEQVRGEEGDARTDVYAAGMVLYELLTGAVAFQRTSEYDMMRAVVEEPARPPREALPGAPAWLDALVLKALAKSPLDRFQSAAEMLLALQAELPAADPAVAGATRIADSAFIPLTRLAVTPLPMTVAAPTESPRSRKRGLLFAGAAMLCVSMTAGWAAWGSSPDDATPQPPARPSAAVPTQTTAAPLDPPEVPVVPPDIPSPDPGEPRRPSRRPAPPAEQEPVSPVAPPVEPPPAVTVPTPPPPPPTPAPVSRASEPESGLADVEFRDVKMLRTIGGKTAEVDVLLTFSRNALVVTLRNGAAMSQSMAYRSVSSAVYSQSKHPRWKEGSAAALAMGVFAAPVFFMKGTRHWLTLEGGGDAIVLRLDKKNYQAILPELEVRTGRRVERDKGRE